VSLSIRMASVPFGPSFAAAAIGTLPFFYLVPAGLGKGPCQSAGWLAAVGRGAGPCGFELFVGRFFHGQVIGMQ